MIKMLSTIVLMTLCSSMLFSQVIKDTSYFDPLLGNIRVRNNVKDGTKEILFHGGYIVKDSSDRILINGNRSGHCGCEPLKNGFWVYYYQNGSIKEQGSFDCGEKVGTWITFYKNASIKQVKNLRKPYSDSFVMQFGDVLNLRRTKPMKDGQFIEYYKNGQIKTSGQYKIVHLKSTVDSLVTTDQETYEKTYKKVEGVFWLPNSIKIGTWKHYSMNGKIQKIENYNIEEDWKTLDFKYWELIELLDIEKPHITIDKE